MEQPVIQLQNQEEEVRDTGHRSVVKAEKVIWCLQTLRSLKVHRTFPGYLCVRWTAAQEGTTQDLRVNFKAFYDMFLAVPGGPEGKPYIYPFVEQQASAENIWYNENVAGSYARSSLREGVAPLLQTVRIDGRGQHTTYSLRERHWESAREHLAYGNQIPVAPLAVLLYRNYPLTTSPPLISDLVHVFQAEFGYLAENGEPTDEFNHLYSDNSQDISSEGWFETLH